MAKNTHKAGQPATPVQQPSSVPEWLAPYKAELELVDRYLDGDQSVAVQIKSSFSAKLNADNGKNRGPIDGMLNTLVVIHGVSPELLVVVYDGKDGDYKRGRAEEALACAKEAETKFRSWSKDEARRVLEAWEAKHPATVAGAGRSAMSMLTGGSGMNNPARLRFPRFYHFATFERRPGGTSTEAVQSEALKRAKLETDIADLEAKETEAVKAKDYSGAEGFAKEIAELRQQLETIDTGTTDIETAPAILTVPEPTLEERITNLEAEEAKAVKAKDYSGAEEFAKQAGELRKRQLETTPTATPVAETPAPTTPTEETKPNGSDGLSLAQAIAACKAPNANKRLMKTVKRYENDDNFGDDDFVATVSALL